MAVAIKIWEIVEKYRKSVWMTQQQFADALTESLTGTAVSRVAVTYWESGKSEPSTDFLLACVTAYTDWRRAFAIDCLRVKSPEVFDSGVIQLPTVK